MKTLDNYTIYRRITELYANNFIENFPKIANHISGYINRSSLVLSSRNFGAHLIYTQSIENQFFDACGIERDVVSKIVLEAPCVKHLNDARNPLYNLLMVMISFYYIHQNEIEKIYGTKVVAWKFIRFYLALKIYSMAQRYIFHYEPKEEVVEYVLGQLNSKWRIVKCKNIYTMIEDFAENNNDYTDKVDWNKMRDTDVYAYVNYMHHRIKEMMKLLFRKVDEAKNNRQSIRTEDIQGENEEGKKYFTVTTNVSNSIDVYSKKIVQAFIQDSCVKQKLIEIACKRVGKVSVQKAIMVIDSIRNSNDSEMLLKIITDIVSYWVISLQKDVASTHSIEFIKKCSSAYSISNTYDIFISDLKKTLNDMMIKYSDEYINTEKKSTLNMFKQTVFLYIVFYISSLN